MLNRLLFVLCCLISLCAGAQQKDSLSLLHDSIRITTLNDSTNFIDSTAQDSVQNINDSSRSALPPILFQDSGLNKTPDNRTHTNSKDSLLTFIQSPRKANSKDIVFYSLAIIVLLFAILKFLYSRYFSNLFRVFFNTSLRQSQLTDQLLQAKLPSLFFNIFFILIGGWYLYLLLNHYDRSQTYATWQILLICAASLATIYLVKFSILKFTGWITGYRQEADTYIFIIFMINKIVAICLMPLIVIIAFSDKALVDVAILISFIIVAVMILMRFLRSYSLLQNRLKISRFHFFIYIAGIEIIPLLVIYKLALIFMSKNL